MRLDRRQFLRTGTAAALGAGALSGCLSSFGAQSGADPESGTLQVATYDVFIDSPSTSPGPWLKERFEEEYPDATIEWQTPENEVNHFIERKSRGAEIDADVYVGLNTDHLIRIDETLDDPLFDSVADSLDNIGDVREGLDFDPENRAVPYDTGYISLVYDENEVPSPETFDDLLTEEYRGALLTQNAQSSVTGRAFLLWTIHEYGEDGYLDYWRDLEANDVRILGSWEDSYAAYEDGEAPMVVSYSTDQVYASQGDADLSRHQIGFLNDQAYANPEGMARFADASNPALAETFIDFVLTPEIQGGIAQRNVQFPATDTADLPEEFAQYAKEPDDPVTFGYEELKGNVDEWVEAWAQQIAGS